MPFTLAQWVDLAAIVSAITDVITIGRDSYQSFYNRRKVDPSMQQKAIFLRDAFSTYSDKELESVKKRIERCRDRFISEGSGEQRRECICSVLKDVKDGNGGTIPDKEWEKSYEQLRCD